MRGLAAARLTIPFEPWKPDEGANLTPEDSTSRRARRPSPGTRLLPCTPGDRLTSTRYKAPREPAAGDGRVALLEDREGPAVDEPVRRVAAEDALHVVAGLGGGDLLDPLVE